VQVIGEEGRAMSTMPGTTAAVTVGVTKRASILFGWLTALIIGAGCFYVGMAAFAGRVAPALHIYSYPEGRCTIQFIRPITPWRHNTSGTTPRYIIVFSFTVHTASNQDYQVVGAGMGSAIVSSNAELQNIVGNYHRGGVYPCWYNPSDPSRVVLYRSIPLLPFMWCSSFAALGLLMMLKSLTHLLSGTSFAIQSVIQVPIDSRRKNKKKSDI
jgi:hypothetical protein